MAKKYKNSDLAELFDGLRFSPRSQKQRQLEGSEQLLPIIDPDKTYPLEFVCFRLTGYRPTQDLSRKFVPGRDLTVDLQTFLNLLNDELAPPVISTGETVYTTERLAKKLSVSEKTIQRWRRKGLSGRMFIFHDTKRRIGFTASAVDRFLRENPGLVRRAAGFTQLSTEEKEQILDRARQLARHTSSSDQQVFLQVARETGRSRETIRSLIRQNDDDADAEPVFRSRRGPITSREIAQICKLHRQGVRIPEIMQRYQRSRASIYRIINKRRAADLLARKIAWIDSPEFLESDADEAILGSDLESLMPASVPSAAVLLSRDQEVALFRRYNYLKYRSALHRTRIEMVHPRSRLLTRIETDLEEAERIHKYIVEANLRLVMSIAGKHAASGTPVAELISEGNLSLMHAVEKFDYTRGYRFSTYATWAIAKDFARRIPAEAGRPDRAGAADVADLPRNVRVGEVVDFEAVERAHHSLDRVIENNLTTREQYVIRNHFALDGGIRRKPKTLKEIGDALGLSKERVRQIELLALQKLRHSLSPEEFDMLTG